jgi:hypothetical protein
VLFATWLALLQLGAAGIVEMSSGLHAARLKKPFLLTAHHLYWTRAAVLTIVMLSGLLLDARRRLCRPWGGHGAVARDRARSGG